MCHSLAILPLPSCRISIYFAIQIGERVGEDGLTHAIYGWEKDELLGIGGEEGLINYS